MCSFVDSIVIKVKKKKKKRNRDSKRENRMYGIAGSTVVVLVMVASTTVERRWGRVYDGSNRSGGYTEVEGGRLKGSGGGGALGSLLYMGMGRTRDDRD